MTNKTRVTLRDIARQANVSVSTVSRALNNQEYVNEATRQTIYHVADALGYPLENLRTTSPSSNNAITLLSLNREDVPRSGNDFEYLAFEGARAELEQQGFNVTVRRLWIDGRNVQDVWNDAGVIWVGGIVDRNFVQEAQTRRMPLVLLGGHILPVQTNCIMADYRHGIGDAVDHLVTGGRQRIGLVNGPPTTSTSAEKYEGLRLALLRNNLPFKPQQVADVVDGWFDVETGYRKTFDLLDQCPEADAIIYAGDKMAMGGLTALKEKGYRIPGDIAVVGFHNYEISRFTDPALTTVGFDIRVMGRMAVQRLCAILDGDDSTWTFLAPTELVIRDST